MSRPSIDAAGLAQLDRKERLLREVIRSDGKSDWPLLHSRGHKFPTVRLCKRESYLAETAAYHYEVTQAGRDYIAQLNHAKWTGTAA